MPFVLFYDGIVSCLRAYSHRELEELIAPLKAPGYEWEIGEERSGFLPVTYLLGYPVTAHRNKRYSIRKAVIGSSREARQAGIAHATAATARSVTLTTTKTIGSRAVVP